MRERLQLRLMKPWRGVRRRSAPEENNPRAVFERMFGDGGRGQRLAQARETAHPRGVTDEVARLREGRRERTREVNDSPPPPPVREIGGASRHRNAIRRSCRTRATDQGFLTVRLHVELMYGCSDWRSGRHPRGHLMRRELNFRSSPRWDHRRHHGLSHHSETGRWPLREVNVYQTQLFASFIEKLAPHRTGTAHADHSQLLSRGLSNRTGHALRRPCWSPAAGSMAAVRGYPTETPMTNLLRHARPGGGAARRSGQPGQGHVDRSRNLRTKGL